MKGDNWFNKFKVWIWGERMVWNPLRAKQQNSKSLRTSNLKLKMLDFLATKTCTKMMMMVREMWMKGFKMIMRWRRQEANTRLSPKEWMMWEDRRWLWMITMGMRLILWIEEEDNKIKIRDKGDILVREKREIKILKRGLIIKRRDRWKCQLECKKEILKNRNLQHRIMLERKDKLRLSLNLSQR